MVNPSGSSLATTVPTHLGERCPPSLPGKAHPGGNDRSNDANESGTGTSRSLPPLP